MMEACSEYDKEANANKSAKHAQQASITCATRHFNLIAFWFSLQDGGARHHSQVCSTMACMSVLSLCIICARRTTRAAALSRAKVLVRARASEKGKASVSQDLLHGAI